MWKRGQRNGNYTGRCCLKMCEPGRIFSEHNLIILSISMVHAHNYRAINRQTWKSVEGTYFECCLYN